jgi:hypothetical protein
VGSVEKLRNMEEVNEKLKLCNNKLELEEKEKGCRVKEEIIEEKLKLEGKENKEKGRKYKWMDNNGINIDAHPRLGMTAHHEVDQNLPQWLKDKSVLKTCCDLFNTVPATLRQPTDADEEPSFPKFKAALDNWLVKIPDRPTCAGRINLARTNSIVHQKEYIRRD